MAELNIKGMRFYGYHGVYAYEREQGGEYEVDVCLRWKPTVQRILNDELSSTINYEVIYATAKKIMDTPVDLIEHLAILLFRAILDNLPADTYLQVKVRKLAPPLGGHVAYAEFVWDGS